MEETNTLSLGGLAGASNTLGAALYFVDYALTLLKVGGGDRYGRGCRQAVCVGGGLRG